MSESVAAEKAPKPQKEFELATMRHSGAHVMAAAVLSLWPKAKFGVGPATENGFFYDIVTDPPITDADLPKIQKRMEQLRKRRLPFVLETLPIDEARGRMEAMEQPFKVALIDLLKEKGTTAVAKETGDASVAAGSAGGVDSVTFYTIGDFVDLCRGPHVDNTGQVGSFHLRSIAGAYWRGNQENPQLQRIHALAYRSEEELKQAIWEREEAERRDHRRLGKQLKLFHFSPEIGSGLPLWLPRGMVIRRELEKLAAEFERADGYQPVATPHIAKEDLYIRSGHLPYYREDMYAPLKIEEELFYLKPMNCPHHHQIYGSDLRSYRELPYRISEYGQVYRFEASGGLSGLMRTRGFCQNDAHIYCRADQAKDEFLRVMRLHARYYDLFDIESYHMRLSLPDFADLKKYVEDAEGWTRAVEIIRAAMRESGYPFQEVEGEAAFYGPKVDFMIRSVVGTEYAISTNQLDFVAAKRFNLSYQSADGKEEPVYVIHRAPLGSHERFTAFLIEHYGGKFPTWLAPVQAVVIPISERHDEYARSVRDKLNALSIDNGTGGLRVEADLSGERMQKKILKAQHEYVPYMLVAGDREVEAGAVAVRTRKGTDLGQMPVETFVERVKAEISGRRDLPDA